MLLSACRSTEAVAADADRGLHDHHVHLLAPSVRRLGLAHVLFASDYPVFDPRDQAVFLRERCGFTERELATIFAASALDAPSDR